MNKELIKLANALDEAGFKKEADQIDALIKRRAMAFVAPVALPAIDAALAWLVTLGVGVSLVAVGDWLYEQVRERLRQKRIAEGKTYEGPGDWAEGDSITDGQRRSLEVLSEGLRDVQEGEQSEPSADAPATPEGDAPGPGTGPGTGPGKDDVIRLILKKIFILVGIKMHPHRRGEIPIKKDDGRFEYDGDEGWHVSCIAVQTSHWKKKYLYFDSPTVPVDVTEFLCKWSLGLTRADIASARSSEDRMTGFGKAERYEGGRGGDWKSMYNSPFQDVVGILNGEVGVADKDGFEIDQDFKRLSNSRLMAGVYPTLRPEHAFHSIAQWLKKNKSGFKDSDKIVIWDFSKVYQEYSYACDLFGPRIVDLNEVRQALISKTVDNVFQKSNLGSVSNLPLDLGSAKSRADKEAFRRMIESGNWTKADRAQMEREFEQRYPDSNPTPFWDVSDYID